MKFVLGVVVCAFLLLEEKEAITLVLIVDEEKLFEYRGIV